MHTTTVFKHTIRMGFNSLESGDRACTQYFNGTWQFDSRSMCEMQNDVINTRIRGVCLHPLCLGVEPSPHPCAPVAHPSEEGAHLPKFGSSGRPDYGYTWLPCRKTFMVPRCAKLHSTTVATPRPLPPHSFQYINEIGATK